MGKTITYLVDEGRYSSKDSVWARDSDKARHKHKVKRPVAKHDVDGDRNSPLQTHFLWSSGPSRQRSRTRD